MEAHYPIRMINFPNIFLKIITVSRASLLYLLLSKHVPCTISDCDNWCAPGGIRTHTVLSDQGILSPSWLPLHHRGSYFNELTLSSWGDSNPASISWLLARCSPNWTTRPPFVWMLLQAILTQPLRDCAHLPSWISKSGESIIIPL